MSQKYVKPGAGPDGAPFVTRHPVTMQPIPPEGAWVDDDAVTRRRLRDGDWVAAEAPGATSPAEQPADFIDTQPGPIADEVGR
jgi:hypothetical protein